MKKLAKKRNLRSETVQSYAACNCAGTCYCNKCGSNATVMATTDAGTNAVNGNTVSMLWM